MIKSKIESLLFISAKPMSTIMLSKLSSEKTKIIKEACEELVSEYKERDGGLQIIKNGEKYQMVSSAKNADLVQEFIKNETTGELTRPSLETLTIIAYRAPISKLDLERIRGVNCSLILRNLLIRGLIEVKSDKEKEETYYSPSFDFIRYLGINDLSELPDYEKLSKDDSLERMLEGAASDTEDTSSVDSTTADTLPKVETVADKPSDAEAMAGKPIDSIESESESSEKTEIKEDVKKDEEEKNTSESSEEIKKEDFKEIEEKPKSVEESKEEVFDKNEEKEISDEIIKKYENI